MVAGSMSSMFMLGMGIGGTASILFWAMGPVGRTFLKARIMGKRVMEVPRDDRSVDYMLPKVDSKGRWHFKDKGETEIYNVDPEDVMVAEGGIRVVTCIDNHSITTSVEKAELAAHATEGEGEAQFICANEECRTTWSGFIGKLNLCPNCKTPGDPTSATLLSNTTTTIKVGKKSINWADIKERAGELVGPGNLAGILGSAFKAHAPIPDAINQNMSGNQKLAIGLIIGVATVAIVGYMIAKSQGLI